MKKMKTKTNIKNNIKTNIKTQLIELLNIYGPSREENAVREYLKPILTEVMDAVYIDRFGNLLAEKEFGAGEGATILLSAHMDTVTSVQQNRKLIVNGDIIKSNKGPLGADDRAGITIILEVLRNLKNFNGVVKVAFSRMEEVGCVGATQIDKNFYKDVNLAIVVDRRGSRDIVVGCGYTPFCDDNVASFIEEAAKATGMSDWKAVDGGISDAVVFAENGINSINLSAGYEFEHTASEYVNVNRMVDTYKLIMKIFEMVNDRYKEFGSPFDGNKIIIHKPEYNYNKYYSGWDYYYDIEEEFYGDYDDLYGYTAVYGSEQNDYFVIAQGDQEVVLTKETLKQIFNDLFKKGE